MTDEQRVLELTLDVQALRDQLDALTAEKNILDGENIQLRRQLDAVTADLARVTAERDRAQQAANAYAKDYGNAVRKRRAEGRR